MKILYVANALMPTDKGYGAAILNACAAFGAEGVPVRLVVSHNPLEGRILSNRHLEKNISIRYLPSLWLYSLLPNRAAFVVQSATFYISVFFWALFKSRRQVVYTRDSVVCLLSFLGFRVVYESHHVPRRHSIFFVLIRRAAKIVVISRALKERFIAAGIAGEKILVAPSGVSLEVFSNHLSKDEACAELGLAPEHYLAVYTGNFTTFGEDKGIEDILKALVQAPRAEFLAVGGSAEDIARYRTLAQKLGVSGRVQLLGSVPQQRLALYQKAAGVLLMPFPDRPHYRHHMSPVKMFEYMASGRPIIASDLPTIREVLTEENAFIVPPGDPAALAGAMHALAENPSMGETRAAAAAANVAKYSWQERAHKVLEFIR